MIGQKAVLVFIFYLFFLVSNTAKDMNSLSNTVKLYKTLISGKKSLAFLMIAKKYSLNWKKKTKLIFESIDVYR